MAKDGEEAERLIVERARELAVAVLDVVMPKRGGLGIYANLRAQNIMTPIVFVTGYDDESLATILDRESVVLLRKPFGSKDLLAQVALVIGEGSALA
jgi:FixJ family two-component response regulator